MKIESIDYPSMWELLGVSYGGYNSEIDRLVIDIMKSLMRPDCLYMTDIAKILNCDELFVETIQYILCSTGLWTYGTSPRGCFPENDEKCRELIDKCEIYFKEKWLIEENE